MRVLVSYHYYRTTDLDDWVAEFPTPPEVFADSGAFSAMTQNAAIDVHEYARWIKRWGHLFVTYANLDVIGHAEATLTNQRVLEDRYGLRPLPVFHVREDWSYLTRYLERYDYVALGVAGHSASVYMPWVVKCFRIARDYATRLHGFGITNYKVCAALPWYSVDSSSWGKGHRYGQVSLWDGPAGRFRTFRLADARAAHTYGRLLRDHGATPAEFATRDNYERHRTVAVNAIAYVRFEQWLRQRHGLIPAPASHLGDGVRRWVDHHGGDTHGVRMYLADARGNARAYNDLVSAARGVDGVAWQATPARSAP